MKKTGKKSVLRAGLIGCGVIGSGLSVFLEKNFAARVKITALCDHHEDRARSLSARLRGCPRLLPLNRLLQNCDLILEAASPSAASQVLRFSGGDSSKTILLMSVGGFLKGGVPVDFKKIRARVLIPSGAITGVDGVLAAREAGIRSAVLRTRKPPAGLQSADYFRTHSFPKLKGSREVCVFRGAAAQAVKLFPQNINVAAVLSLAGTGFQKTRVEIWTSLAYRRNSHEIEVVHGGGTLRTIAENLPSPDNPKTSALAVQAAQAALRRLFTSVHLGT